MFSRLRKHFTYANFILTIALVFVMSGGAYAAGKYLITSSKQISPKVLKALAGKPGAQGKTGAQGPAGSAGAQGPQGPQGPAGEKGTAGTNGGEGKEGKEGKEGSPWTAGGTLPSGKTLKGEWSLIAAASASFDVAADNVSFEIPLKTAPLAHYIRTSGMEPFYNEKTQLDEERSQSACSGSAAEPTASAGNLCVYASVEGDTETDPLPGIVAPLPVICAFSTGGVCDQERSNITDPYGFGLVTLAKEAGHVEVAGTWAVTAK
jgi:hypothetical protein